MPGFLSTAGTTILCAHGGQAHSPAPNPRVKVMGQPVLLQPIPLLVAGCANPPPPANVGPCVTATSVTGAVRLKVMGMPVLLQDSQAICTPTGTPLTVIPTQMRVRGM
jgi:hypothetical protein